MQSNVEVARQYIRAIESGETGAGLARFFMPDAVIREMPNRVAPRGSVADVEQALEAARRGQALFRRQSYTIVNILAEGEWVALEMDWVGVTAVQFQHLPPESEIRDHAAVFLEFREGRIASQRHYDCFEAW